MGNLHGGILVVSFEAFFYPRHKPFQITSAKTSENMRFHKHTVKPTLQNPHLTTRFQEKSHLKTPNNNTSYTFNFSKILKPAQEPHRKTLKKTSYTYTLNHRKNQKPFFKPNIPTKTLFFKPKITTNKLKKNNQTKNHQNYHKNIKNPPPNEPPFRLKTTGPSSTAGANDLGQLGSGDTEGRSVPSKIGAFGG